MKKIVIILLICIALCGCGESEPKYKNDIANAIENLGLCILGGLIIGGSAMSITVFK